ncbi:acyl carrier protein [Streptomyces sp. NBC_00019]|uniref:acyl carrier protein n=1 Tax=Streptomyces sp. NBC_00019 TaxID=2975623 RepID=UPI0032488577
MNSPESAPSALSAPSDTELRSWLRTRVAHYVQLDVADIDTTATLTTYGLDSVYALTLCGDIEDHLGLVLEPTVAWDHPTIDALTRHLEETLAQASPAGENG